MMACVKNQAALLILAALALPATVARARAPAATLRLVASIRSWGLLDRLVSLPCVFAIIASSPDFIGLQTPSYDCEVQDLEFCIHGSSALPFQMAVHGRLSSAAAVLVRVK